MPVYLLTMKSKSKYKRTVEYLKRHDHKNGQFTWGEAGNLTVRVNSANSAVLKSLRNWWTVIKQEGQPDGHEVEIQERPYRCRVPECQFTSESLDVLRIHHSVQHKEASNVVEAPTQQGPQQTTVDVSAQEVAKVVPTQPAKSAPPVEAAKAGPRFGPLTKQDKKTIRVLAGNGEPAASIAASISRSKAAVQRYLQTGARKPAVPLQATRVSPPAPAHQSPVTASYTVKGLLLRTVASIKETQELLIQTAAALEEYQKAAEGLFGQTKRG